ncbi:helix-turn-helix domain-containing protein [uncultured Jatrophihabitans sp.]|uniref:helix-turn-helix domain-containing protein n=1 Tax=uncultured Jatrophihabitans sp. TaxID=1610747 RepID=UPI0035CC3910
MATLLIMTTASQIPTATLPFRLRMSLNHAGMSSGQMALYLGVSRSAVSEWLNGRSELKLGMLRAWSERTDVSLEWLCDGDPGARQAYELAKATERYRELRPDHDPNVDSCAVRESNPQPAD